MSSLQQQYFGKLKSLLKELKGSWIGSKWFTRILFEGFKFKSDLTVQNEAEGNKISANKWLCTVLNKRGL